MRLDDMTVRYSPGALADLLGTDPPTPEQADVIAAPLEPFGVVAGAGSGKTSTMAARVVWLVANDVIRPECVLGLTFTRKAAAELSSKVRQRIEQLRRRGIVGDDRLGGEPAVSTYHSYAARLVADHALREAREPSARLITPAIQWQIMTRLVSAYDGPMDPVTNQPPWVVDAVLALAGEMSEHLRGADEVRAELCRWRRLAEAVGEKRSKSAVEVLKTTAIAGALLPLVEAYTAAKAERDLLDYGDQVALAARIAMRHPEVGAIERSRFGVVLLDEYQDTGHAQRELLRALFGGGHPVTAVGDPCQSIYGWRGASAGGLRRFPEHFRRADGDDTVVSHLAMSFRNGERILDVANRLAEPLRASDPAVPVLVPGAARRGCGRVVAALLETVDEEAAWVAGQVAALLGHGEIGSGENQSPGVGLWPEGEKRPVRAADVAVLCRKRSQFGPLRRALEQHAVPVEVVGLGGLLTVPEVLDVVSLLHVLDEATANASLVRLLTGPRLRLGPRDLVALGRRARALLRRIDRDLLANGDAVSIAAQGPPPAAARPADAVLEAVGSLDETEVGSLVDALDDLGAPSAYSVAGYRRLSRFAGEVAALRRRIDQSLPDLVADTERVLELDVEVAARPGADPGSARVDLDAFLDAAAEFAGDDEEPTLRAFLAYLRAAEEEEFGLESGRVSASDTVKLMTVHAAKGLEWPVVVVPGLSAGAKSTVFPAKPATSTRWTHNPRLLPFPLRGDATDLPTLGGLFPAATKSFEDACTERDRLEERRLAYVATTRAADLLLLCGYWWGEGRTRLGPSCFLQEAREILVSGAGDVAVWTAEPPAEAENPLHVRAATTEWPLPPSGPAYDGIVDGARLVGDVAAGRLTPLPGGLGGDDALRAADWAADVRLLLAERGRARDDLDLDVVLPDRFSVTTLVALRRDPTRLAGAIRRPLPQRPAPAARRGTAFHEWLESHYGQLKLLDLDDLPGAADEGAAPDTELALLQERFRHSEWWDRVPVEVEVPFDTQVSGLSVRGRIDAVFADDDGGWTVVDWKTGARPRGADADAAAVQLAAYRVAWARLSASPVHRVRAAFHYVREEATVRPVDLLDETGLRALIEELPATAPPTIA